MKIINTKKGVLVKVDDEDYEALNKYKWHVTEAGYIRRERPEEDRISKYLQIHRQIMDVAHIRGDDKLVKVDHRNGDRSDNRKCNLRVSTNAQNSRNSRKPRRKKPSSSRFKGVRWHKRDRCWEMYIHLDGKVRSKYFKDEVVAAQAYDNLAIELFGEYACTNADLRLY